MSGAAAFIRTERLDTRMARLSMPVTESGCWFWLGNLDEGGYGTIRISGKMLKAHRASWMLHRGQIPDGLKVLHSCDIPCCINPDHLFLGTQVDNMRDRASKGRDPDTRGTKNGRAKLTEDQVRAIRAETGSNSEIAKRYGVGKSMVSYIRLGRNWGHV